MPENPGSFFPILLPTNVTISRHPEDMVIISSLNIGYKKIYLRYLLEILDAPGFFFEQNYCRSSIGKGIGVLNMVESHTY